MKSAKIATVVASTSLVALGTLATSASAAPLDVESGTTSLKFNAATSKAFASLGISAATTSSAKASKDGSVRFPVTGKSIDPKTAAGKLTHTGGLKFKKGHKSIALSAFTIKVAKSSSITAKVGKARATVFTVGTSGAKISASESKVNVSNLVVKLSKVGATALNKTFSTHAFKAGQTLGSAKTSVKVAPDPVISLKSGATALTLDSGTATALTGLGVSLAPASPAALSNGAVNFPITTGSLNKDSLAGSVSHSGGLTLSKGTTVVTLKDFIITTAKVSTLSADVAGKRVEIATLDLSNLAPSITSDGVTLSGAKVVLSDAGAAALNAAFGTTALSNKTVLGTAVVTGKVS